MDPGRPRPRQHSDLRTQHVIVTEPRAAPIRPGDDAVPPGLLAAGIPPCAITTLDNLNPVMIASTSHQR